MAHPRVVVVGSINEDLMTKVPRLPSPGETVGGESFSRSIGGKGANQALAAARLGAQVWMVGAVGNDEAGRRALRALAGAGVDVRYVRQLGDATGIAQIVVDGTGENMIAVWPGANAALDERTVMAALAAVLTADGVVLANLEVPDVAVERAALMAASTGARFVLNPAPARVLSSSVVSCRPILVPNRHEVELLGWSVEALLDREAVVVVTQGADGAVLLRQGLPSVHQPAYDVTPVDATGAGDAFSAALAWALADGKAMEDAVRYAVGAGAVATLAIGAQSSLPTRSDLEAFMDNTPLRGPRVSQWR